MIKKSIYKKYRVDLSMWEEKRLLFWIIPYYVYSIWENGMLNTKIRLFLINKNKGKYFILPSEQKIKIGKSEFSEKYKNNKWIIPLNYELDLNLK